MQPFSAAIPLERFTTTVRSALGLSAHQTLQFVSSNIDPATGKRDIEYRQIYKGIPLWAKRFIVTQQTSGKVEYLHGELVTGIAQDIESIVPQFGRQEALAIARHWEQQHKSLSRPRVYADTSIKLEIWLGKQEKAHLVWVVAYFSEVPGIGLPKNPVFFIDALTGQVLHQFNGLMTERVATGPGGNVKIGYYYYGIDYPKLNVSVSGGTCIMDNGHVRTVNLHNGTSNTIAWSFPCYNSPEHYTNGAYSPLNDAHSFGEVVYDMYDSWYDAIAMPVLPIDVRVHYGTNEGNAWWRGDHADFGDGNGSYYAYVSLDIVSHEIGHGVTQKLSGLIYENQSGGINEAFSDMAGEAAEYYRDGSNDWLHGYAVTKGNDPVRYIDDPPADGYSIDNVNDYYDGLNVHYSSGVFNKAFYLLATSYGWTTQKAFKLFLKANRRFWVPDSTFQEAANDVYDAAVDLGYPTHYMQHAFEMVGLEAGPPERIVSKLCRDRSYTLEYKGASYHCCPNAGAFYRDDIPCPIFGLIDRQAAKPSLAS